MKSIALETATRCSARCPMCYANAREVLARPEYMDLDKAKRLIREARDLGCEELHPFFTADPLSYPGLWELLDATEALGLRIILFTNGEDLTAKNLERLLRYKDVSLSLSIDAATPETYRKIRPGLHFDTVCENAERALEAARKVGWTTRINYVVLHGVNTDEIQAFKARWQPYCSNITLANNDSRGGVLGSDFSSNARCISPFQGLSILSDGTAVICCQDYKPLLPVGNVFGQGLQAVWAGPTLEWVRQLHSAGRKRELALCKNCKTRY